MAGESYKEASLEEVADFRNGKAISPAKYVNAGKYPVFGSNGQIARSDEVLYKEPVVVIGRVGAYCGSVHYVPTSSWVTDNAIAAIATPGNYIRFLYYLFKHIGLQRTAIGSAQPLMTQGGVKIIRTKVPPLPEQRAIAYILGMLDDKIEINRRMSQTLEEMARAIFKSWFVDFDPVRAKAAVRREHPDWTNAQVSRAACPKMKPEIAELFPDRLVDSELGEIPEGWEIGCVGDLAEVSSGKRPDTRFAERSDDALVPLWGGNGPMAFVRKALFNEPILLTGRVGTLGSVFRITEPCWPSDNTLILRANEPSLFEYLFLQLQQVDFASLDLRWK
jgi:type I restriction enzyme S subunit